MRKYYFINNLLKLKKLENNKSYSKNELFISLINAGMLKVVKNKLFFKKKLGNILDLNRTVLQKRYMNFAVYYHYLDFLIISEDLNIYEFPIQLRQSDLKEITELSIK